MQNQDLTADVTSANHGLAWKTVSAPELSPGKLHRPAIGLIELSSELIMQADMRGYFGEPTLGTYTARLHFSDSPYIDSLADMEQRLVAATDLLPGAEWMDTIIYGCTSASVVIGPERVGELVRSKRPEVPVLTPIMSACNALKSMSTMRIALLTPYPMEVNEVLGAFIEAQGIEIVSATTFAFESGYRMSRIKPSAILDAAMAADTPEAEAVFISCTTLHVSPIIEELEAAIGKPVVSSNQAVIWESCRLAGVETPRAKGSLFDHGLIVSNTGA